MARKIRHANLSGLTVMPYIAASEAGPSHIFPPRYSTRSIFIISINLLHSRRSHWLAGALFAHV
jgi:hypothetical protein